MIPRQTIPAALVAILVGAGVTAELTPRNLPLDELPSASSDDFYRRNRIVRVDPLKLVGGPAGSSSCTQPDDRGFMKSYSPLATSNLDSFGLPVILADGVTRTTLPIPIFDLPLNLLLDTLASEPFVQEAQTFGSNGQYTTELALQHQHAMKFWKTDEENVEIILAGWHSEPLADLNEMRRAINAYLAYQNPNGEDFVQLLQLTSSDIDEIAKAAQSLILEELPGGFSNPLLTFNAFASPFVLVNEKFPASIVMGDGIMEFLSFLGLENVTNDLIHSHELAHVLQFISAYEEAEFDIDKFIDIMFDTTPEESRRIELKADAYAAYFLAHEQGRNFDVSLLLQASKGSFSIGDCNIDSYGHHGTPRQRRCATLWAADLGLQNGVEPIPFREFRDLFDENLPLILNVDPSVCDGELVEEDVVTTTEDEVRKSDDLLIGDVLDEDEDEEEPNASESSGNTFGEIEFNGGDDVTSSARSSAAWSRLLVLGGTLLLAPLGLLAC